MERRKRHLRIKSFTFKINGFLKKFEFDLNENFIGTDQEREDSINSIKNFLENKKLNEIKATTSKNINNMNAFDPTKIIINKTKFGVLYDLTKSCSKKPLLNDSEKKTQNKKDIPDENKALFSNSNSFFSTFEDDQSYDDDYIDDQFEYFTDNINYDDPKYLLL